MRVRLLAVFVVLLTIGLATAQTDRSTLRGTVTDQSGGIIPGADIVVIDLATNVEVRRLLSDSNGNYEVPDLKPGLYRVKVDLAGFRSFVAEDVKLDAGQIRRLDIGSRSVSNRKRSRSRPGPRSSTPRPGPSPASWTRRSFWTGPWWMSIPRRWP